MDGHRRRPMAVRRGSSFGVVNQFSTHITTSHLFFWQVAPGAKGAQASKFSLSLSKESEYFDGTFSHSSQRGMPLPPLPSSSPFRENCLGQENNIWS